MSGTKMAALTAAGFLTAGLVLGACGDDDTDAAQEAPDAQGTEETPAEGGESPAAGQLEVIAQDISFPQDTYEADAGAIDVTYVNEGSITHTLLVEDVDGFKLKVESEGDVDEGTVELEAGEYTIFCDIPGHRTGGMEAELVVS